MRVDREPGEGIVLYSGEKPGDWFVAFSWGFSGYESRPSGWYRFLTPTLHFGHLFEDRSRTYRRRIHVPCWLYDRWADRATR